MSEMIKQRYEKLRQDIGRDFAIEQIVRKYFPNPQTETKLIEISRTVSKYANNIFATLLGSKKDSTSPKLEIVIIPEDICLFILSLIFLPFLYLSIKTGAWLWFVEIYTCFIVPTLTSVQALEAGEHEKSGHFFVYWVIMVGMLRVIETVINLRSMFPYKYVFLKSFISLVLMHPKTEGIVILSQMLVEGFILPILGMREQESRKITEFETPSGYNEDDMDSDPSLVNAEEDSDEWKDSKNEIDECLDVTMEASSDEDGCVNVKEVKVSSDIQPEKLEKATLAMEQKEQNEVHSDSNQTKEVNTLDSNNDIDNVTKEPVQDDNENGDTNEEKKNEKEIEKENTEMVNQSTERSSPKEAVSQEKEALVESPSAVNVIEDKHEPSTSSSSGSDSDFSYVDIANESGNTAQDATKSDDVLKEEKEPLQSDEDVEGIREVSSIVTPVKTNTNDCDAQANIDENNNEGIEVKVEESDICIHVPTDSN